MKTRISDKKLLQKERNVLTAQLSRDRKKIEVELLHKKCYDMTQVLNKIRNAVSQSASPKSLKAKLEFVFENSDNYKSSGENSSENDICTNENSQDLKSDKLDFKEFSGKPTLVTRVIKNKKLTRVN